MRTAILPSYATGLVIMAALSACSGDAEDAAADVPTFVGGLTPAPATQTPGDPGALPAAPGDPAAPAAPAAPGAPSDPAPGGAPTPVSEGQGTPPLAPPSTPGAPGTPAGDPGTPAPPADDGQLPPADPAAPDPGAPPAPTPAAASFFTSGTWHGPVIPEAVVTGTTVSPTSFDTRAEGEPFCVSGSVAPDADYRGIGRLTFRLNQPEGSAPGTVVPTGTGVAFNFTRTTGSLVRVVLQPPANADGSFADGWCYAIPEVRGSVFAPYSEFSTACYERVNRGTFYAGEPIEAISFNAPGSNELPIGYDFCVAGIADGTSAAAAPPAPAGFFDGDISGTLLASFERAVVLDPQGRKLVVQNNGWGTQLVANSQQISYLNNSFTISRGPQGGTSNEPLTFPSLYVGQSGFVDGNDAVATRLDDDLPAAISSIQSIPTRFAHNANNVDANATYDVWFAATPPTDQYGTATGAFLMVWTYKPANRNAIGGQTRTAAVGGQTWSVFVGPRGSGQGATGADANAPVISYVKQGAPIPDYNFDLKDFIDDAVQAGELNGNLLLTDVFAGFEIWSGGQGLSVTNFTVDVQRN